MDLHVNGTEDVRRLEDPERTVALPAVLVVLKVRGPTRHPLSLSVRTPLCRLCTLRKLVATSRSPRPAIQLVIDQMKHDEVR